MLTQARRLLNGSKYTFAGVWLASGAACSAREHLYSWKMLLRCEKNWPAIKDALRRNVDVALTLYRNGSWAA